MMDGFQVGDVVEISRAWGKTDGDATETGAPRGMIGHIRRFGGTYAYVTIPGYPAPDYTESWACLPSELTRLSSDAVVPPEQAAGIVEMLRDRNDCADEMPSPPIDSTNPKDALGVKKAPLRFVPPALAILASDAMADGAAKYGPFNWRETAVRMTVYLEAIERHLLALRDGQDRAEDSGHLHLSHIAACCAIIADADGIGKLIDDRPTAGPAADMLRERDRT